MLDTYNINSVGSDSHLRFTNWTPGQRRRVGMTLPT